MTKRIDLSFDGCAAVFHPAGGSRGAIICAGYGYDELCTYRNFALLADDLAKTGVPTLRFDYYGAGNSLGGDDDHGLLERWLGNIAAAVAWMREKAGIEDVALIGYRLGGMLATLAAIRDPAIGRLALLAPVISGRSYIRELHLQSQLYPVKDDGAGEGGVSVAGFRLNADTVAALKPINLAKATPPALERVLLLDDALGEQSPFALGLASAGAALTCARFPALAALTVDPIRSLSATGPFDPVVAFFRDWSAHRTPTAQIERKPAQLSSPAWVETRHRFHSHDRLFGIECHPATRTTGVTVLFVNGGASRTTGWARMTVGLARSLASRGIASFRVDLIGLGESLPEREGQRPFLYSEAFQRDVSTTLDWLALRGTTRIVAFGACSGAQAVFQTAVKDARLDAIIMANLLRFEVGDEEATQIGGAPTFRSTANYRERIGDLDSWKRLLRGGRKKLAGLAGEYMRRGAIAVRSNAGYAAARLTGHSALGGPVYRKFAELKRRKARVLIVYSDVDDGLGELAIHVGRQGRMLTDEDTRVALIGDTDHNFTSRTSQAALADLVCQFVERQDRGSASTT